MRRSRLFIFKLSINFPEFKMTTKRLEEKGFLQCVSVMKWSERMDLIAIGFANGDLSLFRLSCQRVWNISAPNSMCGKVTTISWRSSDGNILAVGYASYNQVSIIDINTSLIRINTLLMLISLLLVELAPYALLY